MPNATPQAPPARMKSGFIWNMLGSAMNSVSTLLLTMFVTRVSGSADGGIMGLAIGVSFVMFTVASFEVRPYQSTDIVRRFSFQSYLAFRLLTCAVMVVALAVYLGVQGYDPHKTAVLALVCLFRMLGAVSDVFQGLFQQRERMDWAGKSLFLYSAGAVALFLIVLFATKNLLWASAGMIAATALCLLLYDIPHARRMEPLRLHASSLRELVDWRQLGQLFTACLPLFLAVFMNMYENNAARFAIDSVAPGLQAFWTPIFMPAYVINLFSLFLFRPLLTTLTVEWNEGKLRAFALRCGRLLLAIAGITAACLVLGWLLGIPVLEWLYTLELSALRVELMVVLLGGGFTAFAVLLYYIVTIMRKLRTLLVCEAAVFLVTLVITPLMIQSLSLMGAALSYLIIMALRTALFAAVALWQLRSRKKEGGPAA